MLQDEMFYLVNDNDAFVVKSHHSTVKHRNVPINNFHLSVTSFCCLYIQIVNKHWMSTHDENAILQ